MIHKAVIEATQRGQQLLCAGEWTRAGTQRLPLNLSKFIANIADQVMIDCSKIIKLDTIGAFRLLELVNELKKNKKRVSLFGLSAENQTIFELVEKKSKEANLKFEPEKGLFFAVIGRWAEKKYIHTVNFFEFIGKIILYFFKMSAQGRKNLWQSGLKIIQTSGCDALPIVGMMSFLVGIVIAYQLGEQLKIYGADIYVVEASGIAILREFAPLMTAVIIAGRTSTAFAALIGTMKVNDELDALSTMGIPPIERLVLPRIVGLLIALPLLVMWSNIFSILGSMIMTKFQMKISYLAYLERFQTEVPLKHYVLGIIKTPVFAFIISAVGCFQGFQTEMTADSVGIKTTAAAVQAIFLIIIADALFSILFSWRGL